jgi:hypothetical protein
VALFSLGLFVGRWGELLAQDSSCLEVPIRTFSISVDEETLADLRTLATADDRSVSAVVRRALRMLLESEQAAKAAA